MTDTKKRQAERNAWLALARAWRELPVKDENGEWCIGRTYGLCGTMRSILRLNYNLIATMTKKLPRADSTGYCWTWDNKGRQQRIEFCEQMAKELEDMP